MTAGLVLAAAGVTVVLAVGTLDRDAAADVLSIGGLVFAFVGGLALFGTEPRPSLAASATGDGQGALYAFTTGLLLLASGLALDGATASAE